MSYYITDNEYKNNELPTGEYTLIHCTGMAFTSKDEIKLLNHKIIEEYAQYRNIIQIQFKIRGKRNICEIFLKPSMLFLKGWDLGFVIDTELGCFSGNACINLVGNPIDLNERIMSLNVYKLSELGVVTFCSPDNGHKKGLVFLDQAEKCRYSHEPVNRMLLEPEIFSHWED